MKRHSLLLSLLLSASLVYAADAPVVVWSNLFDGKTSAGDNSRDISVASDGDVYWYMLGGSDAAEREITYGGAPLFEGAEYGGGTSYTSNGCILKTNPEGEKVWNIHTSASDAASQGNLASTSDGGVVFTAKVRHSDGFFNRDFEIVDAAGNATTIDWQVERRYYRLLVARADKDGIVKWVKLFDVDHGTEGTSCTTGFIADGFNLNALVVDSDDNIYIGGNIRRTIDFGGHEIVARNVSDWNGDAQKSVGSMFVVKLDGNGEYVAAAENAGDASSEAVNAMHIADGKLFVHSTVLGKGSALSAFGKTYVPEGDFTPVLACVGTDLNAQWVHALKGEKISGSYGYQNVDFCVDGNSLYLTGMFNATITDPSAGVSFASAAKSPREGFLAKFSAADGTLLKGVSSKDSYASVAGLTGYISVFANKKQIDKVCVYGYVMNANIGTFLRTYDAETLVSDADTDSFTLATGGGVPTALSMEYAPNAGASYFTMRGNKAFTFANGFTDAPSSWAVCAARVNLHNPITSIEPAVSLGAASELAVSGVVGGLVVDNAGDETALDVHDVFGRVVKRVMAAEGSTFVSVAPGVYVVAGHKVMVR